MIEKQQNGIQSGHHSVRIEQNWTLLVKTLWYMILMQFSFPFFYDCHYYKTTKLYPNRDPLCKPLNKWDQYLVPLCL